MDYLETEAPDDREINPTGEELEEIIDCDHICTSNCRRVGCNCECGEWHNEEMLDKLCPCGCGKKSIDCKCTPISCIHLLK
jgi:hypothetical protein